MTEEKLKNIVYHYVFEPDNGPRKEFKIELDGKTLNHIGIKESIHPGWTRLEYQQCEHCLFDPKETEYCPVAAGLADLIETFKDTISHQKGKISVITEERTVCKYTAMQDGLSSLIGIFMVTSGCSIMEKLKPMVRYHLPFASIEETIYRASSMYLLGQYFVRKQGGKADLELAGLVKIYEEIERLNQDACARIRSASREDANINALVILDTFAQIVPFEIESTLEKLKYLYEPYLR